MTEFSFAVWVDADSCPAKVREYITAVATAKHFTVRFVANQPIKNVTSTKNVAMIVREKGKDSADNYIYANAQPHDAVITRDILFAERLVKKGITVMNDRGTTFTKYNIADKLFERNMSMNLAVPGLGGKKDSYYGEKELAQFKACFDVAIQNCMMAEMYHTR